MSRIWTATALAGLAMHAMAQQGSLGPLSARPGPSEVRVQRDVELNEHFIFQYAPQELPLMDDFSIDRRQSLWAFPDDPGVDLQEVIYRLEVDGLSEPDMAYRTDTTWYYTITEVEPDVFELEREALPSVEVLVRSMTWPVTSELLDGWPPYNIFDTVGTPGFTLVGVNPDLVQDSLMVYLVEQSTGTYIMNGIPQPLVLWEDDFAHVNANYPVDPPTIGVATFDGLDRTGYPYDFENPTAWGLADRLTSVPINMAYPASDSIYLSFFYQAQGLSGDDQIQPIDSLVLEFFRPEENEWSRVWRTPYIPLGPFQQVMIPIKEMEYLKNGFRFRFLNYATLSGDLDHWHIDYVRLARQRTYDDTVLVDVAYVDPPSSILETYTSVPFAKFVQAPATYMAQNVQLRQRNLDVNDRFVTFGMSSEPLAGGPASTFNNGTNTSDNASSIFPSVHAIVAPPNNYVYDVSGQECDAFFNVEFFTNTTPDINRYNDTARFVQDISNYYAYDDGSAEAGYSLNVAGAKLAYRFEMVGGDSLRAIRMYFDPIFEDPGDGSFLITVWRSLSPEDIIHQNFSFSSPEYRFDGPDKFVEYPLDSTIWVQGTFFVGWVQTTATKMNLGFDRNRNNQDKIFYRTSGSFLNTSFQGSLMMRPVFVSCSDPFASVPELGDADTAVLLAFPNPASDHFRVEVDAPSGSRLLGFDATGRQLIDVAYQQGAAMDVSTLPTGLLLLRLVSSDGLPIAHGRSMIQR